MTTRAVASSPTVDARFARAGPRGHAAAPRTVGPDATGVR